MKKGLSIVLAAVMIAGSLTAFAACGGGGNNGPADASKEKGDVVLSFLHAGTMQKSTPKVEKAVSDYCKEKLGFGVKFKQTNVYNCGSDYQNWIITNQEIDIINVFGADPGSYIKDKSAREMSSLLTEKNAPYLSEEIKGRPESTVFGNDDKIYGISVFPEYSYAGYSYMIRKDVLERCGLYSETETAGKYTDYQQITYSDLNKIFAAVRQTMPTNTQGNTVYPCTATQGQLYNDGLTCYDRMGSEQYPMAVMMVDPVTGEYSGNVENYYTTDAYKEYVQWIGECNEKGYIHPDAETSSESLQDLYKSERFIGAMLQASPGMRAQWEIDYGRELIMLPLSTVYYYVTNPNQALMIPSKSQRPARAMQFIDLLYSDTYLINLMMFGVEGEEWKFVDKEHGYVTEQSPGSRTNNYVIGGFWGDYAMCYKYVKDDADIEAVIARQLEIDKKSQEFQKIAYTHTSPALGFNYKPDKSHTTTIKNISANVMSQYYLTLACGGGSKGSDGTYTGAGSTYDDFIQALNKAKIGKIIEDKQAQYNKWKANNAS